VKTREGKARIAGEEPMKPGGPRPHVPQDDYRLLDRLISDLGALPENAIGPDPLPQGAGEQAVRDRSP
jgi:hypothetical protein